jgi:hypothetical protein
MCTLKKMEHWIWFLFTFENIGNRLYIAESDCEQDAV